MQLLLPRPIGSEEEIPQIFNISTGEGIARFPIERTSVIDMSVSQQSLINLLLEELMKVEKAEYEGQARPIEHDIINHQHYLNSEHVSCFCGFTTIIDIFTVARN